MINEIVFDEQRQDEGWQNDVAKELNGALAHSKSCRLSGDIIDSMVGRIAEFEDIETVGDLNDR